ncbi:hypothetical protein GUJ93_ZPchr0008g13683 [Zizania palustris]|uniref:Uncharacterized protein n=1 Tax=Zizania palustris TaxID=103762 RepID=A0A8J5RWW9_ZIZPA|nr:hypothetical protein GUJ93_ZPchr0008g13683 [Zizania palustris]
MGENGEHMFIVMLDDRQYRIPLTVTDGFSTVLVKPPLEWKDPMVHEVLIVFSFKYLYLIGYLLELKPPSEWKDLIVHEVLLVFSFKHMYLLSYLLEVMWQLYDNAYLTRSSVNDSANAAY